MAYWLEGSPISQEAPQTHLNRLQSASPALLDSSRARLRFALLVCIGIAVFLGFVVFPPRRVSLAVDGARVSFVSREDDVDALLAKAGVQPAAGDVVMQSGKALTVERAVPVVVEADGQTLGWRTRATDVRGLLDELSIEVSPYDLVLFNGEEVGVQDVLAVAPAAGPAPLADASVASSGVKLSITRAVPLTIVEDGLQISFQSPRPVVAMALRDAGIRLGPADEVYPSVATELTAGMQVEVRHAKAVSLRTGASTRVIYTHKLSLKEALAEAGFALGTDDRVEPAVEAEVFNGMSARLVRVAGQIFTEKDDIKRKTVFKPDESLADLQSRVVQGHDGVRVREFKVTIEDGIEVERKLNNESFAPEPVDTVIYYSTASVKATGLSASDFTVADTKHMWGTWYNAASSGKAATDPAYGFTRMGQPLTKGIVAVDPRVIPLGTKLYIPGYGFAIAGDTGGGIIGDMIDLGYPDGMYVDWRTGWTDVYVLAQ